MRTSGKRPSLFAFQDIITSVIGIFVFISILLAISISIEVANEIVDINAINDVNAAAKIAHNKDKISSLKRRLYWKARKYYS